MTQEELAHKASVTRNYISLLELDRNSISVATLMRIAQALGTKASVLMARAERRGKTLPRR